MALPTTPTTGDDTHQEILRAVTKRRAGWMLTSGIRRKGTTLR